MRTIAHVLMCGLSAFALAFSACDDDSGTKTDTAPDTTPVDTTPADTAGDTAPADTTPADTTPADTAQDTTPADTTPADTAQDTTPADTTPPAGACTNAADMAVLGVPENDLGGKAGACALSAACVGSCLGGQEQACGDCTRTCMLDASNATYPYAVSTECTDCFVASVQCTVKNCLAAGCTDPDSESCVTCRENNGCTSGFYTCSGLTPE